MRVRTRASYIETPCLPWSERKFAKMKMGREISQYADIIRMFALMQKQKSRDKRWFVPDWGVGRV
jgi:hypothetical protein